VVQKQVLQAKVYAYRLMRVNHCCGVRSKKRNGITASARLLQPTALLPTGRCHILFPSEKCALRQNSSTTC